MPRKLEVQQQQSACEVRAGPAHHVPPNHVVKPKKLEVQQWQRAHRGPSGHVGKPKKLEAQQQ